MEFVTPRMLSLADAAEAIPGVLYPRKPDLETPVGYRWVHAPEGWKLVATLEPEPAKPETRFSSGTIWRGIPGVATVPPTPPEGAEWIKIADDPNGRPRYKLELESVPLKLVEEFEKRLMPKPETEIQKALTRMGIQPQTTKMGISRCACRWWAYLVENYR